MTRSAAAEKIEVAVQPKKPSGAFNRETVTYVRQFTDRLFTFRTTRDPAFRFENGQFVMIGLEVDGRPLLRAYSMASACGRFVNIEASARRKLEILAAAHILDDLRSPPGNRLEALRGDRTGQYSIRINDQYRICFRWNDGPEGVEIVDYH